MPAPKPFKLVHTDPAKRRSRQGYPWRMETVKDRLIREAFKASAPDIDAFIQEAAISQDLTDVLDYPWWYGCLAIDRQKAPRTEAQLAVLAKAREQRSIEAYEREQRLHERITSEATATS